MRQAAHRFFAPMARLTGSECCAGGARRGSGHRYEAAHGPHTAVLLQPGAAARIQHVTERCPVGALQADDSEQQLLLAEPAAGLHTPCEAVCCCPCSLGCRLALALHWNSLAMQLCRRCYHWLSLAWLSCIGSAGNSVQADAASPVAAHAACVCVRSVVSTRLRCTLVIALGDLMQRWPNSMEPWTANLYAPLADPDMHVRDGALMSLAHLILNGRMKVKGHISKVCRCLQDSDAQVRSGPMCKMQAYVCTVFWQQCDFWLPAWLSPQ